MLDTLDRWCRGVGPVLMTRLDQLDHRRGIDRLAIVSWNVHVGGGDIDTLVQRLRSGALSDGEPVGDFVLLLQEAHRGGEVVPRQHGSMVAFARAIRPPTAHRVREDIATIASRLGLNLYYAPSMRNGGPLTTNEDRGNAILSTLPLDDLTAIELPFERQRRVAVAAAISARTSKGEPWTLTVASAHFDNLGSFRNAWIFAGGARQRQARGLLNALSHGSPLVVGGDFNTWLGYRDPAYLELIPRFPDTPQTDQRATFAGLLRLDHLFFRLAPAWLAQVSRLNDRFGSDHYPLLGLVRHTRSVE
jgi:endonuclease/exonuclease/phosphatase family metal-dependent hydrolase